MPVPYRNFTADQKFDDIGPEGVSIFVQKTIDVVPDLSRVVTYGEFGRIHSRPRVELAESMIVIAFLEEGQVSGFGEIALVIEEVQYAHRFFGDQVDDRKVVLKKNRYKILVS